MWKRSTLFILCGFFIFTGLVYVGLQSSYFRIKNLEIQFQNDNLKNNHVPYSQSDEAQTSEPEFMDSKKSDVSTSALAESYKANSFKIPAYLQRLRQKVLESVNEYRGELLWKISLDKTFTGLMAHKEIKTLKLQRVYPSTLRVELGIAEPELLLLDRQGRRYPLSPSGELLPALGKGEYLDLPLLRGRAFINQIELRKQALEIISLISHNHNFQPRKISEIFFDNQMGFQVSMAQNDWSVILGKNPSQGSFSRVDQVMNYLEEKSQTRRIIDARFLKKVVVRPRNSP